MYTIASNTNLKCYKCRMYQEGNMFSSTLPLTSLLSPTLTLPDIKTELIFDKCLSCTMNKYKNNDSSLVICNNCGMLDHYYCTYKAPEQFVEKDDLQFSFDNENDHQILS